MIDLTFDAAKRVIDTRRRIERLIAKRRAVVIAEQLRVMRGTYGLSLIEVGERRGQDIERMPDGALFDRAVFRDWIASWDRPAQARVRRLSENDGVCLALAAEATSDRGRGGEL